MSTRERSSPSAPTASRHSWAWIVELALFGIGPALVALGTLMAVASTNALVPDQGFARGLPALLVAPGLLAFGLPLAVHGRSLLGRAAEALPRGYPFGPPWLQAGIFVVLILSGASVVNSLVSDYSGSLNGGSPTGLSDPGLLDGLYVAASALLWVFAIWGLALLARILRLGRALDLREPSSPLRARPDAVAEAPRAGTPSPPMPSEGRRAVLVVAVAWGFLASAGIQVLETGVDPISPQGWLATQIFTPIWAGGLAVALLGLDRFLRDLERRYAPVGPRPDVAVAATAEGRGFVP